MRDRFATHDSPPRRFRVSPRSSAKLRRKEKDSRNSSLSRRTFLGRVVKRRGVWMLPHRSDTSRGHLHPPTRPRLTPPPSLPPSRRLSFSAGTPSRPRSRAIGGGLLPCGRLCRHFPGGACAGPSLPATTPALQLPGPARDSLSPFISLLSSRFARRMQRPLSTRQIFSTPSGTALSFPARGEERPFRRFSGLPIVRSETSHDGGRAREESSRSSRTRGSDDRRRFALPFAISELPFQELAFVRTGDFGTLHEILESRPLIASSLSGDF
jgi:hypothetical protein